jgi:adenosylhomocysteine nucleosidase
MLLVAKGVGARCAAAAVDSGLSFQPDIVVSTGFCGALDPHLKIADIVVASCVVSSGGRKYAAHPVSGGTRCVVYTADHVVQTAAEMGKLAASGFGAVEMEAAGAALRAEAVGLPFYCIRAVSDLAGEDMANDFNRTLTPDGHFDTMKLLRGSCRSPLVRIPELLRLRKRCVRAAQALGEFFADCRF